MKIHQVLFIRTRLFNSVAFTGNTIYALHDILKEIEPLNISDLVHDFDLPDPPVPEDTVDISSMPQVSLSSLPPDIRHLLTPSNSHQSKQRFRRYFYEFLASIYENELDDRTQYAFGRGKNTTKISTRDLLNQQKR